MMVNGYFPADYTTDVGRVRLLIPDTAVEPETLEFIFSDTQIEALLSIYSGNVKRAAAQAKDILATDELLLVKYVRTDDLTVDGAKVAAELRAQAKSLRDQADKADEQDGFDYFQIISPDAGCYPEGVPVWGRHLVEIGAC